MITLDAHTVSAPAGTDLDAETIRAASLVGYRPRTAVALADAAWDAAEHLRMVYRDVLRTAGVVELDITRPATLAPVLALAA